MAIHNAATIRSDISQPQIDNLFFCGVGLYIYNANIHAYIHTYWITSARRSTLIRLICSHSMDIRAIQKANG